MSPQTTVTSEFDIIGGSDAITVRKLLTPRGQLLEIESGSNTQEPSTRIRIDALGLESLSWQTTAGLADRLGCDPPSELDAEIKSKSFTESFEINNEYADAVVAKMTTPDGEALVVRAPVKKTELRLEPEMLNELSLCGTDLFSEFLETPHGPHDH
jgi:hypothetical protein